jgi:carbamoyltransferase
MYVLGYSGFTRDSRSANGYRNPFAKTGQDFSSGFSFQDGEAPFQMFPLGFFGHDAAAALLKDGDIVACAAEERFNRCKHSLNLAGNTLLPKLAIHYCLDAAGISIDEVDIVAHYCRFDQGTVEKRLELIAPFVSPNDTARIREAYRSTFWEMMDRPVLLKQFEKMTGRQPREYVQVPHHLAHAASAWFPSGFREAAILTIDGTGELGSSLLAVGRGNRIEEISRIWLPTSLGTLYLLITLHLGFKSLGDEYKVMGLAGYGAPQEYRQFFRSLVCLEPDGSYTLNDIARPGLHDRIIEALGPSRLHGEPIESRHCNIAAALQELLQDTVLHTLTHAREKLGVRALCLAGGVALNSMLNGVIARSGLFDEIFVQPASSDEGASLGAALYAYHQTSEGLDARRLPLRHAYAGPSFDEYQIVGALERHEETLTWSVSANVAADIAREIAGGNVVGWFQGRMEYGPRALGNRTILADPRAAGMKDRINAKVKHREEFRPFAPAVLEEHARDYFDMRGLTVSPYMLFVVPVREEQRANIPAVTHVDGTARVQTVSRDTNEIFWKLIHEFKNLTGVPVVLNTSFNVINEPIVCTPADAIRCFLNTDIDLLAIGDFVARKRSPGRNE